MKNVKNHRVRVAAERRLAMENKLLISGLILASTKSIHEINIDEIVQHAGVSRGTFYKYFEAIPVLFDKLAFKVGLELLGMVQQLDSNLPDPALRVSIFTRLCLRWIVTYPLLGRLLLQMQSSNSEYNSVLFKMMESDIEKGIKLKRFVKIPIKLGSSILIGAMFGATQEMLKHLPAKGYEDKVVFHVLLSFGVDKIEAKKLSIFPLPPMPEIQMNGIVGEILEIHKYTASSLKYNVV